MEKTLLLLSAGQGLFISLALLSMLFYKKWSSFFLGLITLLLSLEVLNTWGVKIAYHAQENILPFWLLSSYWLLPAATFLFGKLNTVPKFKIKGMHVFLFLPAAIEIGVESFAYWANLYTSVHYDLIVIREWFIFTEILPICFMVLAIGFYLKDLFQLRQKSRRLPTTKMSNHIIKASVFLLVLGLITCLWLLEVFFSLAVFGITLFVCCVGIYILGYLSFLFPNFLEIPAYLKQKSIIKLNFPFYNEEEECKRIHYIFNKEKLFLQPNLNVSFAAQHIGLPARYFSSIIKNYHQVDFRTYVNTFRVEEIIKKVSRGEHQQKTLLAIALESGFNSKSTFNKAFKDLKGMPPSDYFKLMQKRS